MIWRAWLVLSLLVITSALPAIAADAPGSAASDTSVLQTAAVADGRIAPATVLSGAAAFTPYSPGALPSGRTDIWLRLRIDSGTVTGRRYLSCSAVEWAQLYLPRRGGYDVELAGVDVPFANHTMPYAMPVFDLGSSLQRSRTVYLHVRFSTAQRLSLRVMDRRSFVHNVMLRRFVHGSFLGVLLAVAIFNLFVFFVLRAPTSLLYVSFVAMLAGNELVATGIGPEYLWPHVGGDARLAALISTTLTFATFMIFARSFLVTRRAVPRLDASIVAAFVLQTLLAIVQYVFPVGRALVDVLLSVQLAGIFLVAVAGVVRWRTGFAPARFFVIAYVPMAIGVFANLAYDAYLPSGQWFFAAYGVEFGTMLQCIIISCSVLDRMNVLNRERVEAERALSNQALRNIELRHMAMTDALTGSANRLAYYDAVRDAIEESRVRGRGFGVLFVDLDGFKAVNDLYGHLVGDELLRIVARRLESTVRDGDVAARLGGDEFSVMVRGVKDRAQLGLALDRVRSALEEPVWIDTTHIALQPSIGASLFSEDGTTADALIDAADRAMYLEKQRHAALRLSAQAIPTLGS